MTHICVIDYGSGNLHSAAAALRRAAGDAVHITSSANDLQEATHIVLPGVGAYGDCLAGVNALPGMRGMLEKRVRQDKVPFLGICVGMQLMLERGHEHGIHEGFGWIRGEVVPITPTDPSLKIPHMGWNNLTIARPGSATRDIASGDHAYFVHSYHAQCADKNDVIATVDYGGELTAMIGKGTMFGTQFHPEKSHKTGDLVLRNFIAL
ncbi:MAG: imidazole glycerol phosphate synthase subunit HisH [Rickettsiales bacterium]